MAAQRGSFKNKKRTAAATEFVFREANRTLLTLLL